MIARLNTGIAVFTIHDKSDEYLTIKKMQNKKPTYYKIKWEEFTTIKKWIDENFKVKEYLNNRKL